MSEPVQSESASVIYAASARKSNDGAKRLVVPLLLLVVLIISLLTVVVVPLLVSGTEPASSRAEKSMSYLETLNATAYNTVEEAQAALGFAPVLPGALPEDVYYTGIKVLEGDVLELTMMVDGEKVIYRTAAGNADLSGVEAEYSHTFTEEVNGVTRSYAGSDEDTLSLAVWADETCSYAVVAENGADAQLIRQIAEGVR